MGKGLEIKKMLFFKKKQVVIYKLKLAVLILSMNMAAPSLNASNISKDFSEINLKFLPNELNLSTEESIKLSNMIAKVKEDERILVKVREFTLGLDHTYTAYMVGRIRALKVFQAFVNEGIDPARISITSLPESARMGVSVVVVKTVLSDLVKKTTKVQRDTAATASETSDAGNEANVLTFNFGKSSAKVTFASKKSYQNFLKDLSQEKFDSVEIVGFTDNDGSVSYNEVLSELRALQVYEIVVRAGFPFSHIEARGLGVDLGAANDEIPISNRVARRVEVRSLAEEKQRDGPLVEVANNKLMNAEKDSILAAPNAAPNAAPDAEAKKMSPRGSLLDLYALGGIYGLGIGKAFWKDTGSEARVTLFAIQKSEVQSKNEASQGLLNFQFVNLRGDYVFGSGLVRPFLGLGLGCYLWQNLFALPSGELEKTNLKKDIGAFISLGVDVPLTKNLILAPDLSVHYVAGEFSGVMKSVLLSLRWRI